MTDQLKKAHRIILIVITILTLLFIWGNSMMPKEISSDESGFVMNILTPVLEILVGSGNVTEHLVRKLAHFSEFAVYGTELGLIFGLWKKRFSECVWRNFPMIVLHIAFTALIDESIQIFSLRGPSVQDIWIDTAGAAFGSCIVLLILFLLKERINSDNSNEI